MILPVIIWTYFSWDGLNNYIKTNKQTKTATNNHSPYPLIAIINNIFQHISMSNGISNFSAVQNDDKIIQMIRYVY